MKRVFCTYLLGFFVSYSEGSATITVPAAGNCGDDTVLTCQVTGSIGSTGWLSEGSSIVLNGTPVRPEDTNKYTETRGTSSFTLTIHNTDLTDGSEYRCANEFDESQLKRLNIECKASAADLSVSVTNGKKVSLTVDKLYPSTPAFSVSLAKENIDVSVAGSSTCSISTQYQGYYRCVWSSSSSLADGSYDYSIVVTTITQADPLTGSFNIVSPKSPVILNTSTLDDNRIVLYGNEGQPLTIRCTSTGGNPIPTVAWYEDSISSYNQLTSSSSGSLQNDGTYTVTLSHTFTPTATDDKKKLICRSYYPQADSAYRGSETTTVMLYLRLKPSQPSVTQVSSVSSGGTVEVRCTTTGSRPAAIIAWSYQGSTVTGQNSSNTDITTETYTVVSTFRRQVTAADNGRKVQCVVTHPTLVSSSERTASVNLNVQFSVPASSTVISGNEVMTATGTATLTLTCTTGSSNPASDITWKNGSAPLHSNRPYTNSTGENNGVVRSQQLILRPTRYMDGDVVTCSVSNLVSQTPVTDTATLDLRYRPLIEPMHDIVAVEGNNTELPCSASSKPASTFKWYREGHSGVIYEGTGTLDSNQLTYRIDRVNRTDAGTYRCNANNGIETADEKSVSLLVHYTAVQSFYIKEHTDQNYVTADEHDALIEFECIVNSTTASTTKIMFEGAILKRGVNVTSLSITRQDVSCYDAGVYTCEGINDYGVTSNKKIFLAVRCVPRPRGQVQRNVTGELYSSATLTFTAIAYPEPGPKRFVWHKEEDAGWVPLLNNDHLKISSSGLQSNLTVLNVTKEDYGNYRLTVTNDIGNYVQHIFLSEKTSSRHTGCICESQKSDQTALVVGVCLGAVCCILASYATYLTILRMRTTRKVARSLSRKKKPSTFANPSFASDVVERQEYENAATDQGEASNQQQYTDLSRYANTDKDTYDVIKKIEDNV